MESSSLESAFSRLEDPRRDQGQLHKLIDIVVVAVCAVISGAETWVDIEDFGEDKENWLRSFLDLPNGIPSHDTFVRVFQLLDPEQLQICFQSWINEIQNRLEGEIVAIDGKTLRHSYDHSREKSAVHLLQAWAVQSGLVLAQREVGEKTNEIPEIPRILEVLYLKGCIVTLDAMGCQTDIVETLVDSHDADYVIALKANQGRFYEAVRDMFDYADTHHPRLMGA